MAVLALAAGAAAGSTWVAHAAAAGDAARAVPLRGETIGRSVQGRPLRLVTVGDPRAPRSVLVVGCVHGTERAGLTITHALRRVVPPAGTRLLVLDSANPDGCRARTRGNARGVDLNRNQPWGWRPLRGVFFAGPRPSSEPESRAIQALVLRERPDVSVWYHQQLDHVDLQGGSDLATMRRYAAASGMRTARTAVLPGTIARWQNHRLPGADAFVVELPAGAPTAARVRAHVRAVLAVAAAPAAVSRGPAPSPSR
jgi:protein MpaA